MFNGSDNGRETLEFYQRVIDARKLRGEMSALDILDAQAGKAFMLAQCIYSGLVQPYMELSDDLMTATGQELLAKLPSEDDSRFIDRLRRAYQWTVRSDVPHEIAVMFGVSAVNRIASDGLRAEIKQTEEYKAFESKYRRVLEKLHGFA